MSVWCFIVLTLTGDRHGKYQLFMYEIHRIRKNTAYRTASRLMTMPTTPVFDFTLVAPSTNPRMPRPALIDLCGMCACEAGGRYTSQARAPTMMEAQPMCEFEEGFCFIVLILKVFITHSLPV
jgi:hypothetical protein